jgi:hypothetical protein
MQAASAPTPKKLNGHESRCRSPDSGSPMPAYECPPAGGTGLATHDILWGDATRAALPSGVPAAALDFRFPDSISIDRFRLRELVSAGKALDDQAAAMAAFADPARQPWRGVGNLNITRFYRASAIKTVNEWSSALDRLLQGVRILRAATQWEGTQNLEVARRACQLVRLLPLLDMPID